jgi:hypothetical protein
MAMTTARVTLALDNLGCGGGEALAIERAITKMPGVTQVYINPLIEMAYVVYDPVLIDTEHLRASLNRLGYGRPLAAAQQLNREEQTNMIEQSVQPAQRRFIWVIPLLVTVVLMGTAIWFWSRTTTLQANIGSTEIVSAGATRTNEGGQVIIAATLQENGTALTIDVAMDTHAVDLDAYDLKQLAVLRIDGGQDVQPVGWEAPKGGHHRSGRLTFPATGADGTPLIVSGTHTIELMIRNLAGVSERNFRWTLEPRNEGSLEGIDSAIHAA